MTRKKTSVPRKDVDSEVPANEPCENTLCQERFQGEKGLTISLTLVFYILEFGAFRVSNSFFFLKKFKAAPILKQNYSWRNVQH